jgi:DNA-binding winged helix-turn-helix (wHTH) protein
MAQPAYNPQTQPQRAPRAIRFGPFELNMETGELRKHGVRIRLQHRPFQILAALLERPGRLVTREELRTKLWASDVFVDFESGLNTAVNRLRLALGDSADNPVYIETLARLGYRFLAQVEALYDDAAPIPVQVPRENVAVTYTPQIPHDLAPAAPVQPRSRRNRIPIWISAAALVLAAVGAGWLILRGRHEPAFQQITFRKGFVSNARFTPDGKHIVYSAEWNGAPSRLFLLSSDGRDSRDLNLPNARLVATSGLEDSAMLIRRMDADISRLETASFSGHAPRRFPDEIRNADIGPDGKLCLVRAEGSTYMIEYPAGHTIYHSLAWIDDVRLSPDGKQVAFAEHPILGDDAGQVALVDAETGRSRVLSAGWESLAGLAWNASKKEIWFTAAHSGVERSLMAVTLDGRTRLVAQSPGGMQLRDVGPSGKVLINRSNQHMAMFSGALPEVSEQNISWLDWSHAVAISADGNAILFDESGAGGGAGYSTFVYSNRAQSPQRIGAGRAMDLSEDGRWALTQNATDPSNLNLVSIETRRSQPVAGHGFVYHWSKFLPDAQQILAGGNFPGQPPGIYRERLPDGAPTLVNSELEFDEAAIDPTGKFAIGMSQKCQTTVLDLTNGHARTIKTNRMVYPVLFINEKQALTRRMESKTTVLEFLDLRSGELSAFRQIRPVDTTGIAHTFPIRVARNLRKYVYSRVEDYSDLFIISGLT